MQNDKPYLDNPLEPDKLPDEPLSFEFVAQAEEGEVVTPVASLFVAIAVGTVAMVIASVFINQMIPRWTNSIPLPATVVGIALAVGWTLNRQEMVNRVSPLWGFGGASLLFVLTLMAPIGSNLLHLTTAVLLLYASGEFAIHWSIVKRRVTDPIIDSTRPEKPHMEKDLDYGELMVPPGLAAVLVATHHLIPLGELVLVAMTIAVWAVASAKCAEREMSPLSMLGFAIDRAYRYPDATKIKPGLVKTPMVDRWLRPVPSALFLACCVLSVISFGSYVASVATPILLLGIWTLMATELSYES